MAVKTHGGLIQMPSFFSSLLLLLVLSGADMENSICFICSHSEIKEDINESIFCNERHKEK